VWSSQVAERKMAFNPFFYQTKLFILVCVLLAAVVLLVVWKVNFRYSMENV